MQAATLTDAAARLAVLLGPSAGAGALSDGLATGSSSHPGLPLEFEEHLQIRALSPGADARPPAETWAVDGGQALVADARCLQLLVTRASRVRFQDSWCQLEEEGELRVHLLGPGQGRAAVAALGLGPDLAPDSSVDANLLRDRWEWDAVARSIRDAASGAVVLVDGDLQPDWRIPSSYLQGILNQASAKEVTLMGVTKHSSLSRGGAPLIGQLERAAAQQLGPRATWWCPIARTRPDVHPGLQIVAARLDPDARFAFRIDLTVDVDIEMALAAIAALSNDAAFPGYPYPLTVADRLAACPGWLRAEVWMALDEALAAAGVDEDVRERAFADRHRLMERA